MPEKNNSTFLGFDYGLKRIGISIGNTISGKASPLKILHQKTLNGGFKAAKEKILLWDPELVVVGCPSNIDGSVHPFAHKCKKFARKINIETNKKVRLVDESYTSALSKGESYDDARAATLILQAFLNELFAADK